MEISDVRVKLIREPNDRLKAVCSITLDGEFVVRDLKVVEGAQGLFVAMPSRKLSAHCPKCRQKNHLRARFCNECGAKLPPTRAQSDADGRVRLHRDIAHPINSDFREIVQTRVIEGFQAELEASKQPGYRPADLEPEEGEEPETSTADDTRSEYDSLIAGLEGRQRDSRDEGRERHHAERRETPRRKEAPQRRETPAGAPARESSAAGSEREAPRRPPVRDDAPKVPAVPVAADRRASVSPPPRPSDDEQSETPFGMGIL